MITWTSSSSRLPLSELILVSWEPRIRACQRMGRTSLPPFPTIMLSIFLFNSSFSPILSKSSFLSLRFLDHGVLVSLMARAEAILGGGKGCCCGGVCCSFSGVCSYDDSTKRGGVVICGPGDANNALSVDGGGGGGGGGGSGRERRESVVELVLFYIMVQFLRTNDGGSLVVVAVVVECLRSADV